MDFGMPTLLELETLEDNVKLAKELGLSFVEINANVPEYQVEAMDPTHLVELTNTYGIGFTLHLDEYLSITDPNLVISEAYIQSVLNSIRFAKEAGITNLTMHFLSGVVFTLPDKKVYVYEKYKDYYFQRLESFRRRVEETIGEADLKLCIENTTGFHPFMQEAIDFLLESKVFGLTYDCGHNVRYQHVDQDFIIAHASKINHMHFHDCVSTRDHIPLGLGELDLRKELRFVYGHAKKVVIEVKTVEGLRESMKFDRVY